MKNIFVFALMLIFTQQINAQFLKKLKSRIKEKVEEVVSNKIGNNNHDSESKELSDDKQSAEENYIDRIVNEDSDPYSEINFKDKIYEFDTRVTYNLKSSLSDNDFEMLKFFNSKNHHYSGSKPLIKIRGNTFEIHEGNISISLKEVNGLKAKDIYNESEEEEDGQYSELNIKIEKELKKTGKSKSILGFKCGEYFLTGKNGLKTSFWITTELGINDFKLKKGKVDGFILEITHQTNNYTAMLKAITIDTNYHKKFNTADYKNMSDLSPAEFKKLYSR